MTRSVHPIVLTIHSFFKRRFLRQLNITDDNQIHTFEMNYSSTTIKETSTFTKTQIKVMITVVLIISSIMFIIVLFRFRNACRTHENEHLPSEIIRTRASQYSEPSSRRGSVGYYTQRYNRPTNNIRSENSSTLSHPAKRLSIPACDHSSKLTAVPIRSTSPGVLTDARHHHHVTSSCDTSNLSNQYLPIDNLHQAVVYKSSSSIANNQIFNSFKLSSPTLRKLCLPCITARNHSRQKSSKTPAYSNDNLNSPTRPKNVRESFERFEPLSRSNETAAVHSSDYSRENNANNFHEQQASSSFDFANEKKSEEISLGYIETQPTPDELVGESLLPPPSSSSDIDPCDEQTPLLISELASTGKDSSNHPSRKYSLNALLPFVRPSHSHPFSSSLTSTIARGIDLGNDHGLDLKLPRRFSLSAIQHRTLSSIKKSRTFSPTPPTILSSDSDPPTQHQTNSSHLLPTQSTSLSSYPKHFMRKIERFRFIDDSASSSTTVTSPIESMESVSQRSTTRQLMRQAIDQFDDYVRRNNEPDEEISSLIDGLNADALTNGSYSDLDILNYHPSSTRKISRPQSFQTTVKPAPVRQAPAHVTLPITIPHSITSLPVSRQHHHHLIELNGHSQSMDFQSHVLRRDYFTTIHETSSSSATLTSLRSSTSLEFDDNTKPSGVLVDDDFLSMSSPVDEHFWSMSGKDNYAFNSSECFPNVGSSPDVEVKYFDRQTLNNLSETSCDEDDDEEDIQTVSSTNQSSGIISPPTISNPSMDSNEQFLPNTPVSEHISSPIHSIDTELLEDDETQESSPNDASEGDESTDNGEIDLVQEFQLSQKEQEEQTKENHHLWSINDRDVYIIEDTDPSDLISSLMSTPPMNNRSQPTSIMKIANNKSSDSVDEQTSSSSQTFKPKVRFNLDPQYEREREWNKVNKLLGNSVEWTDEFEV